MSKLEEKHRALPYKRYCLFLFNHGNWHVRGSLKGTVNRNRLTLYRFRELCSHDLFENSPQLTEPLLQIGSGFMSVADLSRGKHISYKYIWYIQIYMLY